VALLLGQPLLLTGEPGTGKSALARSIAAELFSGRYLELQVKSGTGRTDLLYRLDELGRFRDAQPNRTPRRLLDYFEAQPLGEAILRACGPDAVLCDKAGRTLTGPEPFLKDLLGERRSSDPPTARDLLPEAQDWTGPERWVVLIDEIDKAPRDTPNDLLEEFEKFAFAIPELNLKIVPPPGAPRPIVVVTSNSERGLPDAFLRRCAYHHIRFPKGPALREIVEARLGHVRFRNTSAKDRLDSHLDDLLALFTDLRRELRRPPATAELLAWLKLLAEDEAVKQRGDRASLRPALEKSAGVIAKWPEDLDRAAMVIANWAEEQ
jgi:MoxR-like ATPase